MHTGFFSINFQFKINVKIIYQCMLAIKMRSLLVVDRFVGNAVDTGIRFGGESTMIAKKRSTESTMSRKRMARRSQVRRRRPGLRNGLISMCIVIAGASKVADFWMGTKLYLNCQVGSYISRYLRYGLSFRAPNNNSALRGR